MLRRLPFLLLIALLAATAPAGAQITVSFPAALSAKPLDGRVLFLLSNDPADEPRSYRQSTFPRRFLVGEAVSLVESLITRALRGELGVVRAAGNSAVSQGA